MSRRTPAILLLVLALGGCAIVQVDGQPDPAAIPTGPLHATGGDAVGPVTEVGRGRTLGVGWRYAVYDTADGLCTQLELANLTSAGCSAGPLLPDDSAFGMVGSSGDVGGASESPSPVDGIVSSEVAAVWIMTGSGARLATTLMPLAGAGHDAKAFVGFVPAGARAVGVVASDAAGEVLETYQLP